MAINAKPDNHAITLGMSSENIFDHHPGFGLASEVINWREAVDEITSILCRGWVGHLGSSLNFLVVVGNSAITNRVKEGKELSGVFPAKRRLEQISHDISENLFGVVLAFDPFPDERDLFFISGVDEKTDTPENLLIKPRVSSLNEVRDPFIFRDIFKFLIIFRPELQTSPEMSPTGGAI